jgi:hypothetical protein
MKPQLRIRSCTEPRSTTIGSMPPRVGEFCPSNVARLLLGVVIVVALAVAFGVWLYYSNPHGTSIESPTPAADSNK